MKDFKVGDLVVIRDWDDMMSEYGEGRYGGVNCLFSFTTEMKYLCGKTAVITGFREKTDSRFPEDKEVLLEFVDGPKEHWRFSTCMIEKMNEEEETEEREEKTMDQIKAETTYNFDKATENVIEVLKWCGYKYASKDKIKNGVDKIVLNTFKAKEQVREIFRKHPNWNEDQQAIIFTESYQGGIDQMHLKESVNWFVDEIKKYFKANRAVQFDAKRYDKVCDMYYFATEYEYDAYRCADYVLDAIRRQKAEIMEEYSSLYKQKDRLVYSDYIDGYMTREDNDELKVVIDFLVNAVRRTNFNLVDDMIMSYVENIERYGKWKTNAKVGQKLSRLVQKVLTQYGINNIKVMGTVVHHGVEVPKDYGYNYYFAMFGDAINPVAIRKYTVISLNIMDYLTMSFGHKWSSCHTIDKLNLRKTENGYQGQYSSGTLSYALDASSVIFYTVDEKYDNVNEMWRADKDRRMMFHLDHSGKCMIFGRMYPDSRDVGETGIPAQFRATMQKVLSECLGFNNLWKVFRGTEYCSRYSISLGTHYRDYHSYEDTGISYVTGEEMKKITIGHNPICPYCGEEHTDRYNVFCYDHNGMENPGHDSFDEDGNPICPHCNSTVDTDSDDAIYCEDTGRWYCDSECAFDCGLRYCQDDERYHDAEHRFYDSQTDYYYHDRSEMVEVEIDGDCYTFLNMRHANNFGLYLNDDDEWEWRD